eukprot:2507998-Pleurochrysis_carterae.AAC.1
MATPSARPICGSDTVARKVARPAKGRAGARARETRGRAALSCAPAWACTRPSGAVAAHAPLMLWLQTPL